MNRMVQQGKIALALAMLRKCYVSYPRLAKQFLRVIPVNPSAGIA